MKKIILLLFVLCISKTSMIYASDELIVAEKSYLTTNFLYVFVYERFDGVQISNKERDKVDFFLSDLNFEVAVFEKKITGDLWEFSDDFNKKYNGLSILDFQLIVSQYIFSKSFDEIFDNRAIIKRKILKIIEEKT